jgi:hypothetical protein
VTQPESQTPTPPPHPQLETLCSLRDGIDSDIPYVFHSWLTTYRFSPFARNVRDRNYFRHEHRLIEIALRSGRFRVAHPLEDPLTIVGYAVWSPQKACLHYAVVKHPFRRCGVFRALVPPDLEYYSHRTEDFARVAPHFPALAYNP